MLGVSQTYLSLLETGARPLTKVLQNRMKTAVHKQHRESDDDVFRTHLSVLGYERFAHFARSRSKPSPDVLLLSVLARPDADSRVVEALPWLVRQYACQMNLGWLVRQAKLHDLQNRLGFLLQAAGVGTLEVLSAVRELERARLLHEATLCWDSMPAATREWMRANRTPMAKHWNVLTRLQTEDVHNAA